MQQLPFRKKIYFAMGGLTMSLCDMVFMQWLIVRYAPNRDSMLVAPAIFGACILVSRIFEAIAGPVIGHWSDTFQSPRGRRLPFIRRGLAPLALVFFLMWFPPVGYQHWMNAVYVCVLVPAYLFCYGLVINPYLGLLPEMATDLKTRVDMTTMQAVFVTLSILIFSVMGTILEKAGWVFAAALVAVLTILFMLPLCFGVRETHVARRDEERLRFRSGLLLTLRNRPFLHVVLATSCYWFGLNSILMLVPFWVKVYIGLSEEYVTWLMLPFLAMNLAFFFVFNYLANRHGKYVMFLVTLGATGLSFLLLMTVGLWPGSLLVQSMAVVGAIGMAVAGFSVLPFALLADVVDYDERISGRRREAIYFGFQGTFQKTALGLSTFQFSLLAYQGGTDVTVTGLKLVALSAGIACFLGLAMFLSYPLRDRAGAIQSSDGAAA